jgi:HSP20 family protein
MSHMVDPLSTLRPLREDEIEQRSAPSAAGGKSPLAYDVYRFGDDLVIEFDAPGIAPADIAVRVEGRAVEVTVRRSLNRGPGVDVIEAGRQHGTFRQRLWLGDRWNLDGLTARAEHGVLTLRAPLAADLASRTVEVAHGRAQSRPSQSSAGDQWAHSEVAGDDAAPAAVHSAA